jgi:hypothetical protein
MTKPGRFQRKRTRGWRKPPDGIIVSKPTKWANWDHDWRILGRAEAAARYEADLLAGRNKRVTLEDIERELGGHHLGCTCPLDEPCHADVLLKIANGNKESITSMRIVSNFRKSGPNLNRMAPDGL